MRANGDLSGAAVAGRGGDDARRAGPRVVGALGHGLRRARPPVLRGGVDRPRNAVEAGRAWARGEIPTGEARAAAFAAHDANYAAAAAEAAVPTDYAAAAATERELQYRRLPKHLRPVVFPDRSKD